MKHFLMHYDRSTGTLVSIERFSDATKASAARLVLERSLRTRGIDHEVVILQAADEAALRLTHARYFMTPREIVESFSKG